MPPPNRKRPSSSHEPRARSSSSNSNSNSNSPEPRSKKAKKNTSKAPSAAPAAGEAVAVAGGAALDAAGDPFWELTSNRRVVVSRFGGKLMVSVREYYEKEGQSLPGKKGISMPVAQFAALVELLPAIEAVVKAKGEVLPRPEYERVERGGGGEEEEEEGGGDARVAREGGGGGKRNFEATSEEEG
ncbi:hypothetical protein MMC26_005026 [Xylographa opegraphella]|nr:hypothetical protein [Xylographa opegraphella]